MKITKAIIPVAGLGTRFLPVTKAQPKAMLPLLDKPIIQNIVEEAVASGIKQIFLITDHTKRAVENHFDFNFELEARLKQAGNKKALEIVRQIHKMADFIVIRQQQPKGNGDAILCAQEFIKNEPCAVLFGDDIIDSKEPCLKQLINVFEKYGDPVLAVKRVSKKEICHFGAIKGVKLEKKIYQIKKIVEKPKPGKAPSNLGIVGRYIITPELVKCMKSIPYKKGKEVGISDAFKLFIKTKPAYACEFDGDWYTFGSKQGFLQANIVFALKDKELRKDLKKFLKNIR